MEIKYNSYGRNKKLVFQDEQVVLVSQTESEPHVTHCMAVRKGEIGMERFSTMLKQLVDFIDLVELYVDGV